MNIFVSAVSGEVIASNNWANDFQDSDNDEAEPPANPTTGSTTAPTSSPSSPALPDGTFQYRVVPFNKDNILDDGSELVVNPADKTASPTGWHNKPLSEGQVDSHGNNVDASVGNYSATSQKGGTFDYTYDLAKDPGFSKDAAITNVFYLANRYHDVLYHYGCKLGPVFLFLCFEP
jgi:extracellular elastinolytic metalloproteinase